MDWLIPFVQFVPHLIKHILQRVLYTVPKITCGIQQIIEFILMRFKEFHVRFCIIKAFSAAFSRAV